MMTASTKSKQNVDHYWKSSGQRRTGNLRSTIASMTAFTAAGSETDMGSAAPSR